MLRIMTLNLNYLVEKHGAWLERRGLIIQALKHTEPDIVAFQAVRRRPGGPDQAREISELLPRYPYSHFVPAVERADASADGSAFLARFPAESVTTLALSLPDQPEDPTPRVVLHAVYQLEQGELNLFNCHFSWIPAQAVHSASQILPYLGRVTGQLMLVGDFNSVPDTPAMKMFAQAGFVDLWSSFHPDEPGFTFESHQPTIRIDYVWANPLAARFAQGIIRVGKPSGVPPRLSDHLGLVATLGLNPRS